MGDEVLVVAVGPTGRKVRSGPATSPVATISGEATQLLAVASGMLALDEAHDLQVAGDRAMAARLLGDLQ